jgi:hypothetical protein
VRLCHRLADLPGRSASGLRMARRSCSCHRDRPLEGSLSEDP